MKEPVASRILRYILYAAFFVGLIVEATLPFMLDTYARILYDGYFVEDYYRTFITVFLMAAGALALWLIAELIFVMRTVPRDPFVYRNVAALRRTGTASLILGLLFLLKCIPYATFLTLVSGVVFIMCALIVYTLCALFAQAVRYKEDNELTI